MLQRLSPLLQRLGRLTSVASLKPSSVKKGEVYTAAGRQRPLIPCGRPHDDPEHKTPQKLLMELDRTSYLSSSRFFDT